MYSKPFCATAARALRPMIDALGPDDHVLVDCVEVGFVDGSGLDVLHELASRNVAAGDSPCPVRLGDGFVPLLGCAVQGKKVI